MALKLGTENKTKVAIFTGLALVMLYLGITQLFGGPSTPPRQPAAVRNDMYVATGPVKRAGVSSGPEAKRVSGPNLDPTLHLERLAFSESIEYAGAGRNIFTGEAVVAPIEVAAAAARPQEQAPIVTGPPPPPQPPQIDMRYFGYTSTHDGQRAAFLLKGEDIFRAKPGEIVSHRYKIVSVDAHSVQVTDLSYNNTQTLPLVAN